MANRYRVGIVGLTSITARRPAEAPPPFRNTMSMSHAGALAYMPNMEVAGYCDLVTDLISDFGRTWADVWPDATGYTDYRRMLAEERLDILAVATSDHRHADIAVDGAEAGVRGLFVEKPLATSLEDADRIIAACEANGAALMTDHTWRWDPLYHRVRESVHAGDVGTLSTIVATLTGPRAMLFRNGTHTIDGICFFAESEPKRVFGRLEDGFDHWDRYRGDGGHLPENDPFANGYVEFANGVRAHYISDKRAASDSSYVLYGEKGRIVLTPWGGHQDRTAELLTTDAGWRDRTPDARARPVPGAQPDGGLRRARRPDGERRQRHLVGQGGAQDGADHGRLPRVAPARLAPDRGAGVATAQTCGGLITVHPE